MILQYYDITILSSCPGESSGYYQEVEDPAQRVLNRRLRTHADTEAQEVLRSSNVQGRNRGNV